MKIIYINQVYKPVIKELNLIDNKKPRTVEMQAHYESYLAELSENGFSPEQSILEQFLRPAFNISIVKNQFPYDLPGGYEHWVMWDRRNVQAKTAKELLLEYFNISRVLIIFTNDQGKKSVSGIKHYHIIIDQRVDDTAQN